MKFHGLRFKDLLRPFKNLIFSLNRILFIIVHHICMITHFIKRNNVYIFLIFHPIKKIIFLPMMSSIQFYNSVL